ncbi:MAG: cupin domain-containing protein [Chloroflexota bacterium]
MSTASPLSPATAPSPSSPLIVLPPSSTADTPSTPSVAIGEAIAPAVAPSVLDAATVSPAPPLTVRPALFPSFFIGGFECSTHVTVEGHRLDVVAATQHDVQAREDYALCRAAGIRAVREAARWPRIDRQGTLDLDEVRRLARLGREVGLTQVWDLMHYGYPDDLDPFSEAFVERFATYARAVATVVREETAGPTYYTPVNEISYCAWAGGEVAYMAPFGRGRGGEYKRVLVRAAIAAGNAIWDVDPEAQMVSVDPLVRVHAPTGLPDLEADAEHFNYRAIFEAFDLLAGRLEPELGGSRRHLGVVGLNYYAGNQWTLPTPEQPQRFLTWDDPAWVPLSDLLVEVQGRYGGPLMLAETGAAGTERPAWLAHLVQEVQRALDHGVDLQAICWYPVVTSPDWEDVTAFFDGGLFDISPRADGRLERVLARPVAAALRDAQAALDPVNLPAEPLEPEKVSPPTAPIDVLRPLEQARLKADNFSYQTLCAGESLSVEVYAFQPGALLTPHRHEATEHVLTVLAGAGEVRIGPRSVRLCPGETALVPAGTYHSIHNAGIERLVVQQVSSPKPWDARFAGPHPSRVA